MGLHYSSNQKSRDELEENARRTSGMSTTRDEHRTGNVMNFNK